MWAPCPARMSANPAAHTRGVPIDLAKALADGPVVLDGGLATELERRGHDLSSSLWSARLLADDPAAVTEAHRSFLAAGARVVTTASYQASFDGFGAAGVDAAGTRELLRRSVAIARRAVDADRADRADDAWVAASIGPYGAARADGSEYTGAYGDMLTVPALRRFHHDRLAVLVDAGPDVLALETLPALAEVEALLAELDGLGVPAWLSLTTVTDTDGRVLTRRGEPAEEAFAMARDTDPVITVGVNCTDPDGVLPAVRLAAEVAGKPVVVYPNSGESWDAVGRRWSGPSHFHPEAVADWVAAGAPLIGGCCRVTPEAIAAVAGTVGSVGDVTR
jgi:homocysteine S-methyltransferase